MVHLNSFVGHFTHICGAGVNTDTTALIGDKKVQIRCGWADSGHLSSCSLVRHDGSLVVMRLVVTSEAREKLPAVVHSTVASPHGRHASDV